MLGIAEMEDDVVWREEWEGGDVRREGGVASPARSGKGKEKEREKGKKRVSLGYGGG